MPKETASSAYKKQFLARVTALRKAQKRESGKEWTAEDMAYALGIEPDTYRKYESRSFMPHELLPRFAMITGVSVEYVLTGSRSVGEARRGKPAPSTVPPETSSGQVKRASK